MAKLTQRKDESVSSEVLERALLLACARIADSNQSYEEANTAEGWCEEFIKRAEAEIETPSARM